MKMKYAILILTLASCASYAPQHGRFADTSCVGMVNKGDTPIISPTSVKAEPAKCNLVHVVRVR